MAFHEKISRGKNTVSGCFVHREQRPGASGKRAHGGRACTSLE